MQRFLRAAVAVMAGVAMTLGVTVATTLPADAASSCKATFTSYGSVQKGSTGKQTKAAQCLIKKAGYKVKVDGSFSANDVKKLKKFQKKHHLAKTGVVNAPSWTALLSRGSKPKLTVGKRNASVKRLQNSLTASGRAVPATGYFGSITESAVKSLQSATGHKVTGKATKSVWRELQAGGKASASAPKPASTPAAKPKPAAKPASSGSKGEKALAFAKKQLGDKYKWGAAGPNSWDCSGLTMKAWDSVGVSLPHQAKQQFKKGTKVKKADLRPGDLLFYYGGIKHVAIYAGNGQVIHAPGSGKKVRYADAFSMPFQGARRPG